MTRPNGHRLKNVILQSTKIVTSFFINKLTIIIIIGYLLFVFYAGCNFRNWV